MRLLNTITQTKRERTGLASRLQEHGYTELRVHLTAKALQRLGVAAAAEPAVAQPRYMDGSPFGSR
jgi:hypothetical protein